MLTTIQELEREIEQFHKNVKDSNELMKILMSVASLTKAQKESFELQTKTLQDELTKLPPEMGDLFQKKIETFLQETRKENQLLQTAISSLMESYCTKVAVSEKVITEIPSVLNKQNEESNKRHIESLERLENTYSQSLTSSMERYLGKVEFTTESIAKVPSALDNQLQKNLIQNVEDLKQIQERYAASLAETNDSFYKALQAAVESVRVTPDQIKESSDRQYSAFLKELGQLTDSHMAQLSATESHIAALSEQLETKYNAFVTKLESTNMDQIYQYCQDMNKSISMKLGITLGGVAVAIILSIVALFI